MVGDRRGVVVWEEAVLIGGRGVVQPEIMVLQAQAEDASREAPTVDDSRVRGPGCFGTFQTALSTAGAPW